MVSRVLLLDNQRVRAGDPLVQIDAEEFDAKVATAKADLADAAAGVASARAALSSLDEEERLAAAVERARSALDLALQDQHHTLISAPIDGVVGNRQVQLGDYVQPGTRLLTVVPLNSLYVTANLKETQTGRMTPGLRTTVHVDAMKARTLTGIVDSLAPGKPDSKPCVRACP